MGLFENFFKEAKDLFVIWGAPGVLVEVSPSWEVQLGWTSEELKSKSFIDFIHEEDRSQIQLHLQDPESLTEAYRSFRFQHKNGEYHWLSWSFTKSKSDAVTFIMARDITSLRKNNLSIQTLVDSLDDLILLIDETGQFIDLWTSNSELLFLPKEQIIGRSIRDVFGYFGVGLESIMRQSFKLDKALSMEFQFPNKVGWFSAKVNPIKKTSGQKRLASFLIRDITEKIALDDALDNERGKLLAASKMATLGEMAAGIAHEINNPLAIIQGKSWQLKKQVDENKYDPAVFGAAIKAIYDTSIRISKIISGLKTFARNGDKDPFVEISIATLLDGSLDLCSEKFKNNGVAIRVVGKQPIIFECRAVQISQVFLNMLSNSFDAISGTQDPWVEIQIKELSEHLEISFTDSGKGIPQAIQEKIMQPFFTTKEVGKGTGLGLSINRGIILNHDGDFYYDKSSVNTRFILRLPKKISDSLKKPA